MDGLPSVATRVRFGPFTLDVRSGELHKGPTRLKVPDQSIEILKALLERPGDLVTREELRQRLWPQDTFVDFDHGLNAAMRRLRDALGDSADAPRFVETLPRRGYRFIGVLEQSLPEPGGLRPVAPPEPAPDASRRPWWLPWLVSVVLATAVLAVVLAVRWQRTAPPVPVGSSTNLTRLTFDDGLQMNPTWSPDGRTFAFASNKSGNFDIYVQSTAPGAIAHPVITNPADDWQPTWSLDGRIAFRSERDGGGLFVAPATGGHETRISDFGYQPQWSSDSRHLLFSELLLTGAGRGAVYTLTVGDPSSKPRAVDLAALSPDEQINPTIGWHPNGGVTFFNVSGFPREAVPRVVTIDPRTGVAKRSAVGQRVQDAFNAQMVFHGRGEPLLIWAPDGRAFYFVGNSRGLQNVWKVDVDRESLRLTGGPYRLTSMSEDNEGVSVSSDGTRLVFGAAHRKYRLALYDLDPTGRRIVGEPRLITDPEEHALWPDLSSDGSRLLVHVRRPGSGTGLTELREYRLTGSSTYRNLTVTSGKAGEIRGRPRWAPDGRSIVYNYFRTEADESGGVPRQVSSLTLLDPETSRERQLTTAAPSLTLRLAPYGWTPDGRFVIAERDRLKPGSQIVLVPVRVVPPADRQITVVTEKSDYFMWNTNMPLRDDRWICFNATAANEPGGPSQLGVVSSTGTGWSLLTDRDVWVDKPKWSADGRLIYYLARQGGRATLWGLGFDPDKGVAVDEPFPLIARFNPAEHIPADMLLVELGVAPGRIAVPVVKPAGGIWMLENFLDR